MLLNRQKSILKLLLLTGGKADHMRLVKLFFLHSQSEDDNSLYDFVPYHYGPYSFQMYADMRGLVRKGLIEDSGSSWQVTNKRRATEALSAIPTSLEESLVATNNQYGTLSTKKLVTLTYQKFPYYASRSKLINGRSKRNSIHATATLFSIGYQGRSIDAYLDLLNRNGVHALVDVRYNPQSMKYGFSQATLKHIVEKMGIHYYHLPQLGIPGNKRRKLDTKTQYNRLFAWYDTSVLPNAREAIDTLCDIVKKDKTVALTCFEQDVEYCHRGRLLRHLAKKYHYNVRYL